MVEYGTLRLKANVRRRNRKCRKCQSRRRIQCWDLVRTDYVVCRRMYNAQ
jgi:hypothetical protein